MTHDISSMLAENEPCMWGSTTLVMLVSRTCITVTSITERVMTHLRADPMGASLMARRQESARLGPYVKMCRGTPACQTRHAGEPGEPGHLASPYVRDSRQHSSTRTRGGRARVVRSARNDARGCRDPRSEDRTRLTPVASACAMRKPPPPARPRRGPETRARPVTVRAGAGDARQADRAPARQPAASSTSRTFPVRPAGVNGFSMKAVPGSSTPCWTIASAVYPDM